MANNNVQSKGVARDGGTNWTTALVIGVIGLLFLLFFIFVEPANRPNFRNLIGGNHVRDFFYALSALSFIALGVVFWFFMRRSATDSVEGARAIATFAIVLIGLMILWGIFFQSMVYMQSAAPISLELTDVERSNMSDEEQLRTIQSLRDQQANDRTERIVDIATIAEIIIAPLGTLIGFVAGQAAGSSGIEAARSAGEEAAASARAAISAQRETIRNLGGAPPPNNNGN